MAEAFTPPAAVKVLYIAGSGRSGSTLLERMLGEEARMTSVGELKQLANRGLAQNQRCGCDQPFQACEFWQAVVARAFPHPHEQADFQTLQLQVDRLRFLPNLIAAPWLGDYARRLERYAGLLAQLYHAIAAVSGNSIVVDNSKDVSTLYLLQRVPGIAVYTVHLLRDSRAVAFSWRRRRLRPEITGRQVFMQQHSLWRSTGEWLYRNGLIELAPHLLPGRGQIRFRYEDFVAGPRPYLDRIRALLGLPPGDYPFLNERQLDFGTVSHTVSGNPMRFQQGPVPLRLDAGWRRQMPRSQQVLVTALSWPLLLAYGYLPGPAPPPLP